MGKWRSYLFGGIVRDILKPNPFSPGVRDVDIVIDDADFDRFHFQLRPFVVKRNRFGGLRLVIANVPVDAWPLRQTWAFRQGLIAPQSFRCLTATPFLNIDSIVADISYFYTTVPILHAERFIHAFTEKTLSIELPANPFPWLAAIKATRAMFKYNLSISWPLAVYLNRILEEAGEANFEKEQIRHYGRPFLEGRSLWRFRRSLEEYLLTEEQTRKPYCAFEQWEFGQLVKCQRSSHYGNYSRKPLSQTEPTDIAKSGTELRELGASDHPASLLQQLTRHCQASREAKQPGSFEPGCG